MDNARRGDAPTMRQITVRGTPVHLYSQGAGPAMLFLHGAGGAGRWLDFQAALAPHFTVHMPSHPGHGGSPAAEWIDHISDLAFHYLDLLDDLGLEPSGRVRIQGIAGLERAPTYRNVIFDFGEAQYKPRRRGMGGASRVG